MVAKGREVRHLRGAMKDQSQMRFVPVPARAQTSILGIHTCASQTPKTCKCLLFTNTNRTLGMLQYRTLVEHLNLEQPDANIDQTDAEQEQETVSSQFPVLPPFPLHHP
jgi:hypothetical protein